MKFKKVDYIISFIIFFSLYILQHNATVVDTSIRESIQSPLSFQLLILSSIMAFMGSLIVGTITNLIRKLIVIIKGRWTIDNL